MPSAVPLLRTSRHLPARPLIGPTPVGGVDDFTNVKSSTSNRPVPVPVNVRKMFAVPDGTPLSVVVTLA